MLMSIKKTQNVSSKKDNSNLIVAIDMGTSRLRILAANVSAEGHVNVIGFLEGPSAGISNGAVSDLSLLSNALTTLVQNFETEFNINLERLVIGIAGRHIESRNEHGTTTVLSRTVTALDRDKAIESAKSVRLTEGSHIIHVIPQNYEIDSSTDISNPIGLYAMRLDVRVHLISCNRDQENNFRSSIDRLSPNCKVDSVIYNGLAASHAVLTESEKEIGVCLVDIGAGTINVAVYDNKQLIITFGINRGGDAITRAIASFYGIPLNIAEQLKIAYGTAHTDLLTEEERNMQVSVPVNTGDGTQETYTISVLQLASTISYVLLDLMRSISDRIEHISREMNKGFLLGAGFVLTGGVAQTRGIDIVASHYLVPNNYKNDGTIRPVKVKIGVPRSTSGSDMVNTPDKAVIVGLARFANQEYCQEKESLIGDDSNKVKSVVRKIKDWFSKEF